MNFGFLITNLAGGGAERSLQTLTQHLTENGHSAEIFTMEAPAQPESFPATVKITPLVASGLSKGFWRIVLMPLQALHLSWLLYKRKIPILVGYMYRPNLLAVLAKLLGAPIRVYLTDHVAALTYFSQIGLPGTILHRFVRMLYPRADGIAGVSAGVREDLIKLGIPADKISVVHNPLPIREIREAAEEPHELKVWVQSQPTITTVGRLIDQKDHAMLIRAVAEVRKTRPVQLLIIGAGPLQKKLEEQIVELKLQACARLAGWQSNPYSLVAASQVFALSSGFEGFGIALVEAMACGVAVVSTDCVTGPSEILEDGRWGALVPVGDWRALAENIQHLLDSPELRQERAQAGQYRADEFDVATISEKFLKWTGVL